MIQDDLKQSYNTAKIEFEKAEKYLNPTELNSCVKKCESELQKPEVWQNADIYSTISNPRITTVDVNSYEMSNHAVDIIIRKIQDKDFKRGRVLVTGNLIERDSVKILK